ncbi:MAG: NAD(P)-dependent oxidoreductase, partial [Bacteroidetes bacterium]|nr:NAD(P)-dependent oxidoreductase [Bacteroidota bacterium]
MNALVTGGTGFIGKHLVHRLLAEGTRVTCLTRRSSDRQTCEDLRSRGVRIIHACCESGEIPTAAFEHVSHVFHLAGMTRARIPEDYERGNCHVTEQLLDACARFNPDIERFVFVSSLAAVGPARSGQVVTESSPCHPVSAYGRSKLHAEEQARAFADRLPIVILRPSAVYGPGDRELLSYFRLILHRIFPIVGDPTQRVNMVGWSDVVDALIRAATARGAVGHTYNIGDRQSYQTGEIGETIASIVGIHPLRIHLPMPFAFTLATLSEAIGWLSHQAVFLNREKLRELTA